MHCHLAVVMAAMSNCIEGRASRDDGITGQFPLFHCAGHVLLLSYLSVGGRMALMRGFDPVACRAIAHETSGPHGATLRLDLAVPRGTRVLYLAFSDPPLFYALEAIVLGAAEGTGEGTEVMIPERVYLTERRSERRARSGGRVAVIASRAWPSMELSTTTMPNCTSLPPTARKPRITARIIQRMRAWVILPRALRTPSRAIVGDRSLAVIVIRCPPIQEWHRSGRCLHR
jgi:hypothetical protein